MQHVTIDIALLREGHLLAWCGELKFRDTRKVFSGSVISKSAGVGQIKAVSDILGRLKYPVEAAVSVYGEEISCGVVSELLATFGHHRLEITGCPVTPDERLLAGIGGAVEMGRGVVVYEASLGLASKLLDCLGVDDPYFCFEDDAGGRCFVEHERAKSTVEFAGEVQIQDEIQWDLFE
ncbi:hypothetical protein FY034_18195 (plasmid) [Trichlorobacter lovleyi]|uniref:hypothetical protein n=1 Tax=Trichlorobacter lovleyi TaxID=313985 RepID=UPI002240C9A7|nr:hypothetical protein [Trichlorobacter lovleyi]QOX80933.1 hypothetical protein FY034_18195 [Trichlorobacter lovleyi]